MNLTIIIPYRDERAALSRLLASLPEGVPAIVVDDCSDVPPEVTRPNTRLIRREARGYFSGAVNTGIAACDTDVLVLNQDIWFPHGDRWLAEVLQAREEFALFGQGVVGHPAHPQGYVDGRLMFMRRDALERVGLLNERDWPLWGATCEWQLRACRAGFRARPVPQPDWYEHARRGRYGASIRRLLRAEPERRDLYVRTPPLVSVVIAAYNYGRYLPDAVHSLIGGQTSLGPWSQQSFGGFEVIVVDDASTDETAEVMQTLASPWTAVRYLRRAGNGGTAAANNEGIRAAFGEFIFTMDADDMLAPEALEAFYRAVEANPRAVPYSDMVLFSGGRVLSRWQAQEYDFDVLLERNMVPAGIMFSKAAWARAGGYPEAFRWGRQDWAFAVALGRLGYCGQRIAGEMYYYRREGQNRSLTNTTPKWRERFLAQMHAQFPDLYGGIRPMGCCGGRRTAAVAGTNGGAKAVAQTTVGAEGMVALEYIGTNAGKTSWFGPVTGTRYTAGGSRPRLYVDARDAQGLLEARRDRKPVFRLYQEPAPAVVVPAAPAAVAAPAPEPVPAVAVAEAAQAGPGPVAVDEAPKPRRRPRRATSDA